MILGVPRALIPERMKFLVNIDDRLFHRVDIPLAEIATQLSASWMTLYVSHISADFFLFEWMISRTAKWMYIRWRRWPALRWCRWPAVRWLGDLSLPLPVNDTHNSPTYPTLLSDIYTNSSQSTNKSSNGNYYYFNDLQYILITIRFS